MLPIGAATAVAPCLLCLPVACPLRSGQFKPTPGRTGGGTDAAGRADDLEMKKSRPTIGRTRGRERVGRRRDVPLTQMPKGGGERRGAT